MESKMFLAVCFGGMTILGIAGFIMVALKDADDARHRARIAAMYDRKRGVA